MSIIQAHNLSFSYGSQLVLNQLNFRIDKGQHVAIVGENGSGKSTLAKIILGLLPPDNGQIYLFDTPYNHFHSWHRIGYLPQSLANSTQDLPLTVKELITAGYLPQSQVKLEIQLPRVYELTHTYNLRHRLLNELSGGQLQRVMIARSLINDPDVLILDEPATGVDAHTRKTLYQFLHTLNQQENLTVIHITHDLDRIRPVVNRVLCLTRSELFAEEKELEHIHG
jgi:zinc transport system ATP-binding protein